MKLDAATQPVRFMLVCLLGVLVAGCAQAGPESTTSTSEGSTTSVSEPTTTSLSTSTTTAPDVTIDPHLPSAVGRGQVPWTDVGAGWYVVLYDSSKAYPASESDTREGPVVLYLVNGAGERYEVAAWEPGEYRYLADATAGSALVSGIGTTLDETVYELIDLATGTTSTVFTVNFSEQSFVDTWPPLSLTRPGGSNVVIHRSDGVREWLERRSPDGATLSVVFEQPYDEDYRKMAWLYAADGTSLIVATKDSMRYVSNDGSLIGGVWSPPDSRCEPVRWWAADTLLAVCFGSGPDSAPLDDTGEAHFYYGRLWLIGTDGSPGDPLTDLPTEPPIVVDFGFHDAWPVGEQILVQWRGDCGSSAVMTLDRIGEFLSIREPDDRLVHGVELVDVQDEHMTIYGWDSCAADIGGLFTFDLDGRYLSTLVPAIGDSRGVIGVKELATVYP